MYLIKLQDDKKLIKVELYLEYKEKINYCKIIGNFITREHMQLIIDAVVKANKYAEDRNTKFVNIWDLRNSFISSAAINEFSNHTKARKQYYNNWDKLSIIIIDDLIIKSIVTSLKWIGAFVVPNKSVNNTQDAFDLAYSVINDKG